MKVCMRARSRGVSFAGMMQQRTSTNHSEYLLVNQGETPPEFFTWCSCQCISQLFQCWSKIPNFWNLKEMVFIWTHSSVSSVHGQQASRQKQHERAWWRKASQPREARKQTEDKRGPGQGCSSGHPLRTHFFLPAASQLHILLRTRQWVTTAPHGPISFYKLHPQQETLGRHFTSKPSAAGNFLNVGRENQICMQESCYISNWSVGIVGQTALWVSYSFRLLSSVGFGIPFHMVIIFILALSLKC